MVWLGVDSKSPLHRPPSLKRHCRQKVGYNFGPSKIRLCGSFLGHRDSSAQSVTGWGVGKQADAIGSVGGCTVDPEPSTPQNLPGSEVFSIESSAPPPMDGCWFPLGIGTPPHWEGRGGRGPSDRTGPRRSPRRGSAPGAGAHPADPRRTKVRVASVWIAPKPPPPVHAAFPSPCGPRAPHPTLRLPNLRPCAEFRPADPVGSHLQPHHQKSFDRTEN